MALIRAQKGQQKGAGKIGAGPKTVSARTVRYICTLSRIHDVDPVLAHSVRVAAYRGIGPADADRIIALLRQHDPRSAR